MTPLFYKYSCQSLTILFSVDEIAPSSQTKINQDFIHVASWIHRGGDGSQQLAVYK